MADKRAVALDLVDLAFSDPGAVIERGGRMLGEADNSTAVQSIVLRAMSLAARMQSDLSRSVTLAERSIAEAVASGDDVLRVQALMSLAGSMTLAGKPEDGLKLLSTAASMAEGELFAEVQFQRASILARQGNSNQAEEVFRLILPVFVGAGDLESEAMTLNNLGMLRVYTGDPDGARRYLTRARDLHAAAGNDLLAASASHNLGMVAALEGDVVSAFRLFDESEAELVDARAVSEHQVSRCELLLSAGLFSEAVELAEGIAENLSRSGLAVDEAEARLVAAQSAVAAGQNRRARHAAQRAAEMFRAQGRSTWEANATAVEVAARLEDGDVAPAILATVREAANRLEADRQAVAAFNARRTAARLALALGDPVSARQDLERIESNRRGPVEVRIHSWLAKAMLCDLDGNRRGVFAAARAGLDLVDRYQAAVGASDVRAGVEKHSRELGNIGLRAAIDTGDARRVFYWMERTRANALRHRPVTPPADARQVADLVRLRQVTAEFRFAAGAESARLARESQRLQDSIRNRVRLERGDGAGSEVASPTSVAETLGEDMLIEYADVDGELWAVIARQGRFSLRRLCDSGRAQKELESLRFAMRRLARGRVGFTSVNRILERFDSLVLPLMVKGNGRLIVVPTPAMYAAPWSVLPSLSGRSVSVAPAADFWLRAQAPSRGRGPVVAVAGPDLEEAAAEVRAIVEVYPDASGWTGEEASVANVSESLSGAAVAHIAAHGSFSAENPMFSAIRLADGDLNVYDIERLTMPPEMVVLSACDSGFTDTHPGEELIGLTSSMLSMGTRSVIASVGLVPDSTATRELMVGFHERIMRGFRPHEALHQAQQEVMHVDGGFVAASSFLCIGAG